jgi:tyrosyl-tRNA synthetase
LIRSVEGASAHAFTIPLITKPDGTKYGKTEGGAIWLSPDMMTPYTFYQFWLNVEDAGVPNLLRVFTFRTREEILALEEATRERPQAREAQRALAEDVTTLVHGGDECRRVIAASRALFGQGELAALDDKTLGHALAEAGLTQVALAPGQALPPVASLMHRAGVADSISAARRAIKEGGAYLNNEKVTDERAVPSLGQLLPGGFLVLRRGRRTIGGVKVTQGS